MLPSTLTLLATYQCTAACDQCCFACSPGKRGRIPQDRLLRYIDDAAALGSVVNVVFSGGECFLLGRDLVAAVARANSHGLLTRCVTNGYWATTQKAAVRRLKELVNAGLTEINFSTGDYHQKYVPLERVRRGTLAAYELGLGLAITVELQQQRELTKETLLDDPLFEKIHELDPEGLKLIENVWIPMDANRCIAQDTQYHRNHSRPEYMKGCDKVLRNMVITPADDYVVCCGLTMEQIPELHIGDASAEPLNDLAHRADMDFLTRWIHVEGPERIIEFLQQKDPSIVYAWDKVHPCEACRDIHTWPDLKRALRKYYGEKVGDILVKYQLSEAIDGELRSARDRPPGPYRTAAQAALTDAQHAEATANDPQGRPLIPISPSAHQAVARDCR